MSQTKEMFRVERKGSNAARMRGQSVTPVTVTVGRKYYSLSVGRNIYRFQMQPETDFNGNPYYPEVSEYASDFLLYETYEAARDYLRRDALLFEVNQCNFMCLDVDALADIVSAINNFRERKREIRRKNCE